MTACTRVYRIVGEPWVTPDEPTAQLRLNRVGLAELRLRERLAAGEVPDVRLVGPEWGVPARVGAAGEVSDVWAWSDMTHPFATGWLELAASVTALIDGDVYTPDPASAHYAAAGSVLVGHGRLTSLRVRRWLRPVAEQLADRYGVTVYVSSEEPTRPVAVEPGCPVVLRAALPAVTAAALVARFRRLADVEGRPSDDGKRAWCPPLGWDPVTRDELDGLMRRAADAVGLPVDIGRYGLMAYTAGQRHDWHTDRTAVEARSAFRTVSFSLLLSQPGRDFTGGTLLSEYGRHPLDCGDLAAFSATTRHAVEPVTGGERIVVVGFGESTR